MSDEHDRLETQYEAMKARDSNQSAVLLLSEIVREIEDIDEAYWTHRLYSLVERAKAIQGPSALADTHPKGGDVKQAPLVSGAVGSEADETPKGGTQAPKATA